MKRRIRLQAEAAAELTAAAERYEAEREGLGLELLAEASRVYARLEGGEHGTRAPGTKTSARRIAIARFPLWVVFVERDGEVVVVAYAHERRRPGYWRTRRR